MDYEEIKSLARVRGCGVKDLIVLAPQNDPFYVGTPATVGAAEWFAGLWQEQGFTTGVHLRRVHYRLVSAGGVYLPDGASYENTEACWQYLCNAGKYARQLRLVDPSAFVDRRNPEPHVFARYGGRGGIPEWEVDAPLWRLPTIQAELSGSLALHTPGTRVFGYAYSADDQPYHLELWVEKSTMDDILLPLGGEYNVNVVTSLGFQSITSVVDLLKRVARSGKPARIFYISDFDPAGDSMPAAVARQVEFWMGHYAPGADLALTPLALTRDQVISYRLPRIPVKDSDRRKAVFEARYGEGAVELDALEALCPGELARLVVEAIAPYRDTELPGKLAAAEAEAGELVREAWEARTADVRCELAATEREARTILDRYSGELRALRDRLAVELAPVGKRLDGLWQAINERERDLSVAIPERPEADAWGTDEDGWLFSSARGYEEQLRYYGLYRSGNNGVNGA